MKEDKLFSHLTPAGEARMVNVSEKTATKRMARAEAWVDAGADIIRELRVKGGLSKGNVVETARIAGIMAAKRTSGLIPMCHPLTLDSVEINVELLEKRIRIECSVYCEGKTGVEMEAMTGAAVSALTVYDMVKSAEKGIRIGQIRLIEKEGGKSGRWRNSEV